MSDAPKPVVPVSEAKSAPQSAPPAPAKTKFRFFKNLNPSERVIVDGKPILFHVPVKHTGHRSSHGVFDTVDAELAKKLRDLAKANPSLYIFER